MSKATISILMLLTMWTTASLAASKIEFVESKDKIDVKIDGKIVTTYIYGDKRPKPSFVPVRTLSGIELTRRYPLTELPDILACKGLWFIIRQSARIG